MTLSFLNVTPTTTIFLHLREMGLLTSTATISAATGQSAQVAQHTAFKMENRVLNMFVFAHVEHPHLRGMWVLSIILIELR